MLAHIRAEIALAIAHIESGAHTLAASILRDLHATVGVEIEKDAAKVDAAASTVKSDVAAAAGSTQAAPAAAAAPGATTAPVAAAAPATDVAPIAGAVPDPNAKSTC